MTNGPYALFQGNIQFTVYLGTPGSPFSNPEVCFYHAPAADYVWYDVEFWNELHEKFSGIVSDDPDYHDNPALVGDSLYIDASAVHIAPTE